MLIKSIHGTRGQDIIQICLDNGPITHYTSIHRNKALRSAIYTSHQKIFFMFLNNREYYGFTEALKSQVTMSEAVKLAEEMLSNLEHRLEKYRVTQVQ